MIPSGAIVGAVSQPLFEMVGVPFKVPAAPVGEQVTAELNRLEGALVAICIVVVPELSLKHCTLVTVAVAPNLLTQFTKSASVEITTPLAPEPFM